MPHRLSIFISSTGDLKAERDAVESVLAELEIDCERFETWPSMPCHPIEECLLRVGESDAVILLLGTRYGTLTPSGKSVTHLEYECALERKRHVFSYLLAAEKREPDQEKFIELVFSKHFRCQPIANIQELKRQVKSSLTNMYVRCFRLFQEPPLTAVAVGPGKGFAAPSSPLILDVDPEKALQQLFALYKRGGDSSVNEVASECKKKFNSVPEIMNVIYMAKVNLAMQGTQIESECLLMAIRFWETAEAKKRWPFETLYNQGNAYGVLGLRSEAINYYKAALAINSAFAKCWVNLGNAYFGEGDVPSAWDCLGNALILEADLFEALYSSAVVAINGKHDYEKALLFLNRLLTFKLPLKHKSTVYGWRANALLKLHRYAEGIADAENAIAGSPESQWAWEITGRLYALARQDDKSWLSPALAFWRRFVAKYPNNALAWAEIGYVCWFLRKFKDADMLSREALNAFEKSLTLGLDDSGWVSDRIGHLHQEAGNAVEAEQAYRKAYFVNSAQFGYCLGTSLMDLERHAEALPLLLAAAEQHQPDAISWHMVAICYEKTGKTEARNLEKAEAAYKKAIEVDPNYAEALFNLGGYYWNLGDHLTAYETWEIAIHKFPIHRDCERVKRLLEDPFQKK